MIDKDLRPATMTDALLLNARHGAAPAVWIESMRAAPSVITRAGLVDEARRIAAGLRGLGVRPHDRILLALPTSADFVHVFCGALLCGAVPVPIEVPASKSRRDAFALRASELGRSLGARLAIEECAAADDAPPLQRNGSSLVDGVGVLVRHTVDEIRRAPAIAAADFVPDGDHPAFIQLSSGSTGAPRGICLSHANVIANARAIVSGVGGQRAGDVNVSWMPLYHDMGLIGGLLVSLVTTGDGLGPIPAALFSPHEFIRQPALWLRVLAKYRGTVGMAPNFAFQLCTDRVRAEALAGVDLSSVRILLNGSEPVSPREIERFERAYETLGLCRGSIRPCYGLGENSLAVTISPVHNEIRTASIQGAEIADVGEVVEGTELEIRDIDGRPVADDEVGEIYIRGTSRFRGYVDASGLTAPFDGGGWFATGDLGFLRGCRLFVSGRLKDLIIVGGRNVFPADLEHTVSSVDGVRKGRVAVVGTERADLGTQAVVVVVEPTSVRGEGAARLVDTIRQTLQHVHGITPYDVVLLRHGALPFTSSGKIRRFQVRSAYLDGSLLAPLYALRGARSATNVIEMSIGGSP